MRRVGAGLVVAVILAARAALAQDPVRTRDPQEAAPRFQNDIHLHIVEHIDEPEPYPYTRQPYRLFVPAPGSLFSIDHERYFTARPRRPTPLPPGTPSWEPLEPPPPLDSPDPSTPGLDLTLEVSFQRITIGTNFGSVITGNARNDPLYTKPGLLSSGGGDRAEDSDRVPMTGPQLDWPIQHDLTEWEALAWLPPSSSLHLYARALFGSFDVFDVESDLELYSVGPRLLVPFLGGADFRLGAFLSGGPAYLRTDIGSALGLEAAAGLRAEWLLLLNLPLVAAFDYGLYSSENATSTGPGLNFGLTFKW